MNTTFFVCCSSLSFVFSFFFLLLSLLDPTLTVENVREVMAEVVNWKMVGDMLGAGVPISKQEEISQLSSTERDKALALGEYWVNTDPHPSWESLAMALYQAREGRAPAVTKQYLQQGMCSP